MKNLVFFNFLILYGEPKRMYMYMYIFHKNCFKLSLQTLWNILQLVTLA